MSTITTRRIAVAATVAALTALVAGPTQAQAPDPTQGQIERTVTATGSLFVSVSVKRNGQPVAEVERQVGPMSGVATVGLAWDSSAAPILTGVATPAGDCVVLGPVGLAGDGSIRAYVTGSESSGAAPAVAFDETLSQGANESVELEVCTDSVIDGGIS